MMESMLPQALRFGILGAARIAPQALVNPARGRTGVSVDAVAARALPRAEAFARRHQIARAYGSYEALLADEALDAIYICVPNAGHADWSMRALAAGKHVLCEKPLASNAAEAAAIAEATQQTDRIFMEAFHNRYHPLVLRMREIVASGELGALQQVRAIFRTPMLRRNDIRFEYVLGGGATMDMGCYLVNLLRYVLDGEPTVVTAHAELLRAEVDRRMRAQLRFTGGIADGVVAEYECEMRALRFPQVLFEVVGAHGAMRVINPVLPQIYHSMAVRTARGTRKEHFGRVSTYAAQLQAFAEAVRTGTPPPTDAQDGVRTMRVLDAMYEAAGLKVRGAQA